MGVDLRLLPIDFYSDRCGTWWGYSHTILNLPRNSYAWDAVRMVKSEPIRGRTSIFAARRKELDGELGYGDIDEKTKDAYGDLYRMVKAGDLLPVLEKHFTNHPITAYVKAMIDCRFNPTDLIILDWH